MRQTIKDGVLLSLVTVHLNDFAGLLRTATSLAAGLGESGSRCEWIVVDGGSDGFNEQMDFVMEATGLIPSFAISEPDGGIYDAMNKGLTRSRGRFIIFANAGDTVENLQRLLEAIEDCDTCVFLGDVVIKDGTASYYRRAKPVGWLRYSTPTIHQAIVFPGTIARGEGYSTAYKVCGDYDFTLRVTQRAKGVSRLGFPTAHFYRGGTSSQRPFTLALEAAQVQRRLLGLSRPEVAFWGVVRLLRTLALSLLLRVRAVHLFR